MDKYPDQKISDNCSSESYYEAMKERDVAFAKPVLIDPGVLITVNVRMSRERLIMEELSDELEKFERTR